MNQVEPLGVRHPDGAPLFDGPVAEQNLWDRLAGLAADARRVAVASWTFDEREQEYEPRLDDPGEAGWTIVVASDDPDRDAVVAALEPLARLRGMIDPDRPLVFPAGADRGDWIDEQYKGLPEPRPRYLLLAGDPVRLPFPLQVDLAAAGALVGRVGFAGPGRVDDLRAYVDKVVRLADRAAAAAARASAVVFAPNGGPRDPTSYSRRFLAAPVAGLLRDTARLDVTEIADADATTGGLVSALTADRPAILFTASHGAGRPTADGPDVAHAVNGAWACSPPAGSGRRRSDWDWLAAADLPAGPVVPGGVVVQFACFGYGTSDHSSFAQWLGGTNAFDAAEPFVAAVPERLLARPDGPVAYVGHVDLAVLHGFDDPARPVPAGGAHPRVQPFLTLVDRAVRALAPIGYACHELHERGAALGSDIATTFDGLQQSGTAVADLPPEVRARLVDKVIRRNDAMHFLVLGDPAARVRIDDDR